MSAVWFSMSCDATHRNGAGPHVSAQASESPVKRFVPRQVLVKFKNGVSQERIVSILKSNRTDLIAELQQGRLYHVTILNDRSIESVITELTSHPEVEYAEPNYRYETQK
ncbi:MAG: hypothetical protein A4E19_16780 [Nitrospira sp. SG-bin1]|nr:MAG: hypothetical protein A4E19_16780 [Nitrospira sp. SG-bin1]